MLLLLLLPLGRLWGDVKVKLIPHQYRTSCVVLCCERCAAILSPFYLCINERTNARATPIDPSRQTQARQRPRRRSPSCGREEFERFSIRVRTNRTAFLVCISSSSKQRRNANIKRQYTEREREWMDGKEGGGEREILLFPSIGKESDGRRRRRRRDISSLARSQQGVPICGSNLSLSHSLMQQQQQQQGRISSRLERVVCVYLEKSTSAHCLHHRHSSSSTSSTTKGIGEVGERQTERNNRLASSSARSSSRSTAAHDDDNDDDDDDAHIPKSNVAVQVEEGTSST